MNLELAAPTEVTKQCSTRLKDICVHKIDGNNFIINHSFGLLCEYCFSNNRESHS